MISHTLRNRMSKIKLNLSWIDLKTEPSELRPDLTFTIGQCFSWRKIENIKDKCWIGMIGKVPLIVKQTESTTFFAHLKESITEEEISSLTEEVRLFFQLDKNLTSLYQKWGEGCDRMKEISKHLVGVRVLRQDPWECLISFICSSNNNISRITQMIDKLRYYYGSYCCTIVINSTSTDGKTEDSEISILHDEPLSMKIKNEYNDITTPIKDNLGVEKINGKNIIPTPLTYTPVNEEKYENFGESKEIVYHLYSFPTIEALATAEETDLRKLGIGYRAKFIIETAKSILEKQKNYENTKNMDVSYLHSLRKLSKNHLNGIDNNENEVKIKIEKNIKMENCSDNLNITEISVKQLRKEERLTVQRELMELHGVGRKVADCVALFSLDCSDAIPVDTHVWDIALRDYLKENNGNSENKPLSLTPKIYEEVGDVFRQRFLRHAGWAHSILFAAELPEFRKRLPEKLQEEMKNFIEIQRSLKKLKNEEKIARKEGNEKKKFEKEGIKSAVIKREKLVTEKEIKVEQGKLEKRNKRKKISENQMIDSTEVAIAIKKEKIEPKNKKNKKSNTKS